MIHQLVTSTSKLPDSVSLKTAENNPNLLLTNRLLTSKEVLTTLFGTDRLIHIHQIGQ